MDSNRPPTHQHQNRTNSFYIVFGVYIIETGVWKVNSLPCICINTFPLDDIDLIIWCIIFSFREECVQLQHVALGKNIQFFERSLFHQIDQIPK